MNRRQFLSQAALGAVATGATTSCSIFGPSQGGVIDAHVHVWTPDTAHYPLAPGYTPGAMQPPSFTPEQLFAHTKREGVTRIVLIQMSYYGTDNRYMLDTIRQYPRAFKGVAIVNENDAYLPHTMRALAKQGVSGFRITPGQRKDLGAWLGSPGMATLWRTAAENGQAVCPLINPEALPLIDRMCQRYPRTTVVVDHFARLGMAGPVQEAQLQQLCSLARHRQTFVKTSAFYALSHQQKSPYVLGQQARYSDLGPMIYRVREAFGASRLMWASDAPFQVGNGHTYHDSIALIRDRLDFLSEFDKAWMLRGTAEQVFFG